MSVAVVPVAVVNVGDRGPRGIGHLASLPSLMIKQTRRGCIQELFGCEAKNEDFTPDQKAKVKVWHY